MKADPPRLRLFAGPNGSGKSTLVYALKNRFQMGYYLNADDILVRLKQQKFIHLDDFGLLSSDCELQDFLASPNSLLSKVDDSRKVESLKITHNILVCHHEKPDSYLAAVIAAFLRNRLLQHGNSMSFESVMSHPSKVDFLAEAQKMGFRTYLYFIATNNPSINVSRVKNRESKGGHGVPEDKIVSRYHRSIDLLASAIRGSHRAYIFDNSSTQMKWIAEFTNGGNMVSKTDPLPDWFAEKVLPNWS